MSSESEVIQLRDSALLGAMNLVAATKGPTLQSQGHPQGCLDKEGMTAQLMKPFLPGFLRALSAVPTASRWLLSLASLVGNIMTADMASGRASPDAEQGSVVGPKEAQGSPSLRGLDSSQMPTQLNEQPPPDDADSKQAGNKENVSVNQASPNRSQGRSKKHADASSAGEAESSAIDHAFVKAVLAAAHAAQVKEQLAGVSATLAMQCWQQGNFASSLGAVHLTCMLGFPSPSTSRHGLDRTECSLACFKLDATRPSIKSPRLILG
ncbi:hypothetical protein WJX79_009972 [Trebouxia sp. C0005]